MGITLYTFIQQSAHWDLCRCRKLLTTSEYAQPLLSERAAVTAFNDGLGVSLLASRVP